MKLVPVMLVAAAAFWAGQHADRLPAPDHVLSRLTTPTAAELELRGRSWGSATFGAQSVIGDGMVAPDYSPDGLSHPPNPIQLHLPSTQLPASIPPNLNECSLVTVGGPPCDDPDYCPRSVTPPHDNGAAPSQPCAARQPTGDRRRFPLAAAVLERRPLRRGLGWVVRTQPLRRTARFVWQARPVRRLLGACRSCR